MIVSHRFTRGTSIEFGNKRRGVFPQSFLATLTLQQ